MNTPAFCLTLRLLTLTRKDNKAIGGFVRLATAIEQVRERKEQENEPVLVFSAGDYLGGVILRLARLSRVCPRVKITSTDGL